MMLGMCCWITLDTATMSFSSMLVVLTEKMNEFFLLFHGQGPRAVPGSGLGQV